MSRTHDKPAEQTTPGPQSTPAPEVPHPGAPSVAAETDGQSGAQAPADPAALKASDAAPAGANLTPADQAADAADSIALGVEADPVTEGFAHAIAAQEAAIHPGRLMTQGQTASASREQVAEAVILYVQGVRRAVTVQEASAVLRLPEDEVREAVEASDRLQFAQESIRLAA